MFTIKGAFQGRDLLRLFLLSSLQMVVLLTVTRHTYCIKMCVGWLLAVPLIWRVLRSRKGTMIGFLRGRSDDVTVRVWTLTSWELPWDFLLGVGDKYALLMCCEGTLKREYCTFHFYILFFTFSHIQQTGGSYKSNFHPCL